MAEQQMNTSVLQEVWAEIGIGFSTYLEISQKRIAAEAANDIRTAKIIMEETVKLI